MSTARKNLLATIKAATNRAMALGNNDAVCKGMMGMMAYTLVCRAPDTVAVTPVAFAKMIGASTGTTLTRRKAA